jgi:2'-phosphotransferase
MDTDSASIIPQPQSQSGPNNNNDCKSPKIRRNLKKLSHQLSLGLRHKAIEFGWSITPDGYVPVQDVLNHSMFQNYTESDIIHVVQTNDKQRFTLNERPLSNYYKDTTVTTAENTIINDGSNDSPLNETISTILCIRANQGHSLPSINADLLLHRLSSEDLLRDNKIMVHGTSYDAWECIKSSGGLSKMNRNHIHFASGLPKGKCIGTTSAISGMRKTSEVYIYINIGKCVSDDVHIYESDNGVLLTAGVDNSGVLPMNYFSHVTDASGTTLLEGDEQRQLHR